MAGAGVSPDAGGGGVLGRGATLATRAGLVSELVSELVRLVRLGALPARELLSLLPGPDTAMGWGRATGRTHSEVECARTGFSGRNPGAELLGAAVGAAMGVAVGAAGRAAGVTPSRDLGRRSERNMSRSPDCERLERRNELKPMLLLLLMMVEFLLVMVVEPRVDREEP